MKNGGRWQTVAGPSDNFPTRAHRGGVIRNLCHLCHHTPQVAGREPVKWWQMGSQMETAVTRGDMPADFSNAVAASVRRALETEHLPATLVISDAPVRFQPALRQ